MIWLRFLIRRLRFLAVALVWDVGRFFGLPLHLDPRDGFSDRAITPQVFGAQVAAVAKMIDPEFRPVEGNRAALEIIFRFIFGQYFVRFRLWRTRCRLSKIAGVSFKTDTAAMAYLDFCAAELARQQRKEPQA